MQYISRQGIELLGISFGLYFPCVSWGKLPRVFILIEARGNPPALTLSDGRLDLQLVMKN